VDDDLPAGTAGVAVRSSDHEAPGGVDEKLGAPVLQAGFIEHRLHYLFDDGVANSPMGQLARAVALSVLGGHHDGANSDGAVVLVFDRDLGLAVGPEPLDP